MYIDGRPKASKNIAGFINSTRPWTTYKLPNCIFEGREGNRVFIYAKKSIVAGEELLIDYNLANRCGGSYYGGNYLIQHLTKILNDDLFFFLATILIICTFRF